MNLRRLQISTRMSLLALLRRLRVKLRPAGLVIVASLLLVAVVYALGTAPISISVSDSGHLLKSDDGARSLYAWNDTEFRNCSGTQCDDDEISAPGQEMTIYTQSISGYRNGSDFLRSIFWSNSKAVCVGSNSSLGEIDDLLCMPKPKYVEEIKNPCWWEVQNTTTSMPHDPDIHGPLTPPTGTVRSLSCLPYFHILCCSKSGTTDMFRRISMHPDIVPNFGIFGKERLYWSWSMYGLGFKNNGAGVPQNFSKYIKGFGILARYLEQANAKGNAKDLDRLVTLDGSPPDMWDLRGWTYLPQNRNLRQPAVTTAHLMRHLYRDPKFLILAREPVERLYTAYLFHGMGHTAHGFHEDAVKAISMMNHCLETAQDRIECFVNSSLNNNIPVDLHFSCYAVYYEEWLKVFPRKHFLFMRTEEYSADIKGSLYNIFDFLDIPKPSPRDMTKMVHTPNSYHTTSKDAAGPMLDETRKMLQDWFIPWNRELARLMNDKGYLWDYADDDDDR